MAGTIVTGRLNRLECGFATAADDAALRSLLRETPMGGSMRLTLEREPGFFHAARIEGERHYTVCAREAGRIVGMASRSVRTLFVNGAPTKIGYLSQLRIAESHRCRTREFLRIGFAMLRETHADDEAPFDITTIVSDNESARRILEAGLPGLPRYRFEERILTMALPVNRGRGRPAEISSEIGSLAPTYQFSPIETPVNLPVIGVKRKGRVVGSAVVWDQREFKQIVVRGYSETLERWRWLLRLPTVGTVLPLAYLSHFVVVDDDHSVCKELLEAGLAEAQAKGYRWLALGLASRHPLADFVVRRYRPRVYESRLYIVHEPGTHVELDGRIPHLEVASL